MCIVHARVVALGRCADSPLCDWLGWVASVNWWVGWVGCRKIDSYLNLGRLDGDVVNTNLPFTDVK